jgi:hypothetical protein
MSTIQKSTLTRNSLFTGTGSNYSFSSEEMALSSQIERKYFELLINFRAKLWKNEILYTIVHALMIFQAIIQTLPWYNLSFH